MNFVHLDLKLCNFKTLHFCVQELCINILQILYSYVQNFIRHILKLKLFSLLMNEKLCINNFVHFKLLSKHLKSLRLDMKKFQMIYSKLLTCPAFNIMWKTLHSKFGNFAFWIQELWRRKFKIFYETNSRNL